MQEKKLPSTDDDKTRPATLKAGARAQGLRVLAARRAPAEPASMCGDGSPAGSASPFYPG